MNEGGGAIVADAFGPRMMMNRLVDERAVGADNIPIMSTTGMRKV